jgi:hypothetical protein
MSRNTIIVSLHLGVLNEFRLEAAVLDIYLVRNIGEVKVMS